MKAKSFLLCLSLLIPAELKADNELVEAPQRPAISLYTASRIALYAGTASDLTTTEIALNKGAVEGNPLMQHRGVRYATGVGMSVLFDRFTHRMAENHPRRAALLNMANFGAHAFIAAHNMRVQ